jgi:hypothetical protein
VTGSIVTISFLTKLREGSRQRSEYARISPPSLTDRSYGKATRSMIAISWETLSGLVR